jgi:hemolysin type calcium-binding protein
VIRQGHLIAVVSCLVGCAVLLMVVGCAGIRSEAPQEEEQGHTEATKQEQGHSPKAASEEDRCEGTRTFTRTLGPVPGPHPKMIRGGTYVTNDVPGCPNGGPLSGTNDRDLLAGEDGDDEVRGLGARDTLLGGYGSDAIYAGAGMDSLEGGGGDDVLYGGDGSDRKLHGGAGEDVLYGGDGNDDLDGSDRARVPQRDKLYCGNGRDTYHTDWPSGPQLDYVSSSCEEKQVVLTVP